jgi:ubiquinone/menaquinone biosynthesis C-methylase UbiE/DUF971 family protein
MKVPARIDVEGGTRVVLTWEDNTQTTITARTLRAGCLCADCRSEAGQPRIAAVLGGQEEIIIKTARLVGAYAVNFEFAPDSHRTGIFTFDQLSDLGSTESTGSSESGLWDGIAEGWHRWIPRMREWYAPVTSLMLDLARIGPGSRVLDVAAGDGDQSLAAANRVGSGGYVLATDPAGELLSFAQQSAERAGVENLETRVMKAENLQLPNSSFDAVICRFGLMFFTDRDRGLREMNRVLRKDGRVSLVVYGVDGSPEFSLALATIRRRLGLSEHAPAAAASLGEPGVLEQLLEKSGFGEVELHAMTPSIHMASAAECVAYLQDASPTLRETLSSSPPDVRTEAWKEIEQALSRYQGPTGFEVDHRILIAAGTRV